MRSWSLASGKETLEEFSLLRTQNDTLEVLTVDCKRSTPSWRCWYVQYSLDLSGWRKKERERKEISLRDRLPHQTALGPANSVFSQEDARKTEKKRAESGNFDFLSHGNAFISFFAQNCYTRNTNKCHKLGTNDNGIPVQCFSFISAKIDLTTPPSPLATQHTVPSEIRYN